MLIDQHQLRLALSERADETRPELERAEQLIRAALHRGQAATGVRHRRMLTGLATAAAVAALVVVPVTLGRHAPASPAPLGSSQVPAPTTRATPPGTRAVPVPVPVPHTFPSPTTVAATSIPPATTSSTSSTSGTPTTAAASPGTVRTATLVNAIGVGVDRSVDWDLGTDAEYVTVQLPGNTHASVTAFAPGVGFSTARIAASQRVTVVGRPGWYGDISVWPANGKPDPATGKQNGAVPSVAWQQGATWVILQSDDPTVVTPAQLAALAGSLRLTDRPPVVRLPFTLGYVPMDLSVQSLEYYRPAGGDSEPPGWDVVLASGSTSLTLSFDADKPAVGVNPGAGKPEPPTATPPFELHISGTQLTDDQLTRVRRSATTTADPAGSEQGWPTLEEALP